jgi:hypothetical protein
MRAGFVGVVTPTYIAAGWGGNPNTPVEKGSP